MEVTKVDIIPIRPKNGLMAFAAIEIEHQFYVSSIGIHKKRDGNGYRITFPTRKVGEHNLTIFHPTQPELSKEIEWAITNKAERVLGL